MSNAKGYVAGGACYLYPGVGDPPPAGGAKVHLLTRDGIAVTGCWADDGRFLGWAPLHKRDRAKEALLLAQGQP